MMVFINCAQNQLNIHPRNIGEKNTIAAKKILKELNIKLVAEDTGLNFGRTVELHCETGEFYIKAVNKPVRII